MDFSLEFHGFFIIKIFLFSEIKDVRVRVPDGSKTSDSLTLIISLIFFSQKISAPVAGGLCRRVLEIRKRESKQKLHRGWPDR